MDAHFDITCFSNENNSFITLVHEEFPLRTSTVCTVIIIQRKLKMFRVSKIQINVFHIVFLDFASSFRLIFASPSLSAREHGTYPPTARYVRIYTKTRICTRRDLRSCQSDITSVSFNQSPSKLKPMCSLSDSRLLPIGVITSVSK